MSFRVLALVLCLAACGDADPAAPEVASPPEAPAPRSYAMGWAPSAPRADTELLLAVIDSMSGVSEVAIVQQPVPWAQLLGGDDMEPLIEERGQLADFLRAKGMEIVWLVDPLDGLDRRRETRALTDAGRSIVEPEIRALHEGWVRAIAERVRPEWFGLASEINTLAALGDPALYAELVDVINGLAPEVRSLSPGSRVFVSFQADQAVGRLGDPVIDHLALIPDFDIDALGLSSYPVFAGFPEPGDIPDDYFDPFDEATDLPLILVEGGWSSEDVPWASGTPREQAAWFDRTELLLDRIEARLWVLLTPTDFDIASFELPPERAEGLSNFAFMGIWDTELERKPAWEAWARIFARPLDAP